MVLPLDVARPVVLFLTHEYYCSVDTRTHPPAGARPHEPSGFGRRHARSAGRPSRHVEEWALRPLPLQEGRTNRLVAAYGASRCGAGGPAGHAGGRRASSVTGTGAELVRVGPARGRHLEGAKSLNV